MNSHYQQLVKNLEYLKLKQMHEHLDEIIDTAVSNQQSFVETLVKWTNMKLIDANKTWYGLWLKSQPFLI